MTPEVGPEGWVKLIAEVIAAGSLIVGVLTYIKQKIADTRKQNEQIIRNWQRVAIYKAIAEANADNNGRSISFSELKNKYIAATVEFGDTEIPKNEIQDSALRLALMSLLEGKLIELLEDGTYRLSFISSWKQELERIQLTNMNKERLSRIIEAKLATSLGRKQGKSELWDTLD